MSPQVAAEAPGAEYDLPDFILGQKVVKSSARVVASHHYRKRLRVSCCAHEGCSTSRSVALDVETFGVRSAEYYLATWLHQASSMSAAAHRKWRPVRADIRAYLDSRPT